MRLSITVALVVLLGCLGVGCTDEEVRYCSTYPSDPNCVQGGGNDGNPNCPLCPDEQREAQ